jgi:hypothetical protein
MLDCLLTREWLRCSDSPRTSGYLYKPWVLDYMDSPWLIGSLIARECLPNPEQKQRNQQCQGSITAFALNPLTPELNPSAQRCLTRFFTGDFASWTVHLVKICVKNQQIQQWFIQFINYVWLLLHASALYCHPQGAFLVPSERRSVEEQSIEYCGWACCV